MQDQPSRRLPIGIVAGLVLLVIGTGSATAWWTWQSTQHSIDSTTPSTSSPSSNPSQAPETAVSPSPAIVPSHPVPQASAEPNPAVNGSTLQVYWIKSSANKVELVPSPVQLSAQAGSDALLKSAVGQLLSGSSQTNLGTAIPASTKLLSLDVKPDGVHINLSNDFQQGGGSTSMTARIGQLLYTVTSLQPDLDVWLSIEGKPLETLGGEGLMIDQPINRKSFARDFVLQ